MIKSKILKKLVALACIVGCVLLIFSVAPPDPEYILFTPEQSRLFIAALLFMAYGRLQDE